jgi:hypothetical protein
MTTVTMEEIRDGIVANLTVITDCQKLPTRTENPTPPALVVAGFDEITPIAFGRGGASFTMLIQGLAGLSTRKGAEKKLDAWLSPFGDDDVNVWKALESDRTLGGTVSTSFVVKCDGTQKLLLDNGTEVLGTTWHLEIDI